MTNILLHIGYHKTGSTWLQRTFFNQTTFGFTSPFDRHHIVTHIVRPSPLHFDADICAQYLYPALEAIWREGTLPIISCESLSGAFLAGGHDSLENADRLQRLFPQAKILLVIREQHSMILSTYSQYIKAGGMLSLQKWLNPAIPLVRQIIAPYFSAQFYQYHYLIAAYQQRFGTANVLILPYEQLHHAPTQFLRQILHFCQLDAQHPDIHTHPYHQTYNPSLSPFSLAIKRHLNRLIGVRTGINFSVLYPRKGSNGAMKRYLAAVDRYLPIHLVTKKREQMKQQIAKQTAGLFQESNQKTAVLTQLDLAQWGYLL